MMRSLGVFLVAMICFSGCAVNDRQVKPASFALNYAAAVGDVIHIQEYLDAGINIHTPDQNGATPLHAAVGNDYYHAAKLLIESGADVNRGNKANQPPIFFASANSCGSPLTTKLLLENGADLSIRDDFGNNVLHPVISRPSLNIIDLVQLLIEYGADPTAQNNDGKTPLELCYLYVEDADLMKLLIKKGARLSYPENINAFCDTLRLYKDYELADMMIQMGINLEDPIPVDLFEDQGVAFLKKGATYLHLLAAHGVLDSVKYLIQKDMDPNRTDSYQRTPLHYCVFAYHSDETDEVFRHLVANGSDINMQDQDGRSPLHLAFTGYGGDEQTLDPLIQCGADPNLKDNNGNTPLHYALASTTVDMIKMLIDHGADVNVSNHTGVTPLHVAYGGNFQVAAQILLENGADSTKKDKKGRTPEYYEKHLREVYKDLERSLRGDEDRWIAQ